MSHEALYWAWRQPVRHTRKIILVLLADRANQRGDCYYGQGTISELTSLSERAVVKHLQWLKSRLMIDIEPRYRRGRRTSNLYRLRFDRGVPISVLRMRDTMDERGEQLKPLAEADIELAVKAYKERGLWALGVHGVHLGAETSKTGVHGVHIRPGDKPVEKPPDKVHGVHLEFDPKCTACAKIGTACRGSYTDPKDPPIHHYDLESENSVEETDGSEGEGSGNEHHDPPIPVPTVSAVDVDILFHRLTVRFPKSFPFREADGDKFKWLEALAGFHRFQFEAALEEFEHGRHEIAPSLETFVAYARAVEPPALELAVEDKRTLSVGRRHLARWRESLKPTEETTE